MPADVIQRNTLLVTHRGFSHHPAVELKAVHCVHITPLTCWTDLISAINRCWQTLLSTHSIFFCDATKMLNIFSNFTCEKHVTNLSLKSLRLCCQLHWDRCASVGPLVIFHNWTSIFSSCRLFVLVYHYKTTLCTLFLVYLVWAALKKASKVDSNSFIKTHLALNHHTVPALTSTRHLIRSNFPKRPSC